MVRTLFSGADDLGYYLFFPMPYRERARISIRNRSVLPIELKTWVDNRPPDRLPDNHRRFRATWHTETPFGPDHRDYCGVACRILNLDGRDNYEFLNVRAGGHFVGCGFHADLREAPTDRAAGEG